MTDCDPPTCEAFEICKFQIPTLVPTLPGRGVVENNFDRCITVEFGVTRSTISGVTVRSKFTPAYFLYKIIRMDISFVNMEPKWSRGCHSDTLCTIYDLRP